MEKKPVSVSVSLKNDRAKERDLEAVGQKQDA